MIKASSWFVFMLSRVSPPPARPITLKSTSFTNARRISHTAAISPVLFNTTRIKANCFCYVKINKTFNRHPLIKHCPCGVYKVTLKYLRDYYF